MDINIRIQFIKSQIENMNLQIDNIQNQNNIMNMNLMNNKIGEQLFNLSFQLLNTGIQAFNTGKSMITIMDTNNFYERLKNILEQINLIINQNDMNQMQQQQMMIQQQMMMQQQIMMQQQMNVEKQLMNDHFDNRPSINIIFANPKYTIHKINISAKFGTKVEEVLSEYINRISGNDKKFVFLFNANEIKRNEQRAVEKYFLCEHAVVQVLQI